MAGVRYVGGKPSYIKLVGPGKVKVKIWSTHLSEIDEHSDKNGLVC